MTIQELADASGYHRVSLARLIRSGEKIPGVKRSRGRKTVINDCSGLREWIAEKRKTDEHRFRNLRYHKEAAERRAKKGLHAAKPERFITASEAALRLGEPVSRVRRKLGRLCYPYLPEARGKRLFYPVSPQVEKWLSSVPESMYWIVDEEVPRTGRRLEHSIIRAAGAWSRQCAPLNADELQRASSAIISQLKESRAMVDDLIELTAAGDFPDNQKVLSVLMARGAERSRRQ